jgi:hypothetical protein
MRMIGDLRVLESFALNEVGWTSDGNGILFDHEGGIYRVSVN